MPNPELSQLQAYIDQLIEATRSGLVTWKAANPTTYYWNTQGPPKARLILQRSDRIKPKRDTDGTYRPAKVPFYQLQAFEITESSETLLRISVDSEEESLSSKLESLYEFIKTGISQQALDFLKEIIPHP
jgi:hypothetical protein